MSLTETHNYVVQVICHVEMGDRDQDDLDVPDSWDVDLPEESSTWSKSEQATYVLDRFHESVAIAMLDDFEFCIFAPNGELIFED